MMRHQPVILIALCGCLAAGGPALAVDRFVPYDGSPESYPTIQDAVNACDPFGDVIWVAAGTYAGTGFTDVLISGLQVDLVPQTDEPVTLDCEGIEGRRALYIQSNAVVTVQDFIFVNGAVGSAIQVPNDDEGGAIKVANSWLTLTGCIFHNNMANQGGALGMVCTASNPADYSVTLNQCTFSENFTRNSLTGSRQGGALYANAGPTHTVAATETVFIDNYLYITGSTTRGYGAGMYLYHLGHLNLTSCLFQGNYEDGLYAVTGGAIYFESDASQPGGDVQITSTDFVDNVLETPTTSYGAGLHLQNNPQGTLAQVTFSGNRVSGGFSAVHYGAGLCADGNFQIDLTVTDGVFQDNLCVSDGTTIGLYGRGGGAAVLTRGPVAWTDCRFEGNQAALGGGLYLGRNDPLSTVTLERSVLLENQANEGGGVYVLGGAHELTNCALGANYAAVTTTYGGGGLAVRGGSCSVHSCTIAANETANAGGGIFSTVAAANLPVRNSILWANTCPLVGLDQIAGDADVQYSDVQRTSGVWPGSGNINANPDLAWNYHLNSAGSPARESGSATGAPSSDIDGDPRPWPAVGGGYDMGCDEWTGSPPPTVTPTPVPVPVPATGAGGLLLAGLVLSALLALARRR